MRYYSDITKKFYSTAAECEKEEKEVALAQKKKEDEAKQKAAERKADAEKVDKAYKYMVDARKNYEQVLSDFCNKHGAYHKTIKSIDADETVDVWDSLSALIDFLKP